MKLREALQKKLTKKELKIVKTAYDMVGSIAIIEVPRELVKKEKIIAETILELNKHIKTVVKKAGKHKGKFRLQKYKILAGEKKKETEHKENNCRFKLHIEKTYFSVRLSTERKRIAELVKPNETVLIMFSGVAPYPCVIAKNSQAKEIYGIEINPTAHKYAEENIILNKLNNVKLIKGDVKKIIPKLKKKFDRIAMPLPKSAENFLPVALKASKKGTIIHFYDFLNESEFDKAEKKVKKACEKAKLKYKLLGIVKCGQHSPRVFRICVDFEIL